MHRYLVPVIKIINVGCTADFNCCQCYGLYEHFVPRSFIINLFVFCFYAVI